MFVTNLNEIFIKLMKNRTELDKVPCALNEWDFFLLFGLSRNLKCSLEEGNISPVTNLN